MESVINGIESIFADRQTTIARDLKLNLKKLLTDSPLAPEDRLLAVLALATSAGHAPLADLVRAELLRAGIEKDWIQEAEESAAIMAMLNTYYRFRHMVGKDEDYSRAGLRMTALARPAMGKTRFEMLALAVSILNGCESCIRSHEGVLRNENVEAEKIHELARLASVVRGTSRLRAA